MRTIRILPFFLFLLSPLFPPMAQERAHAQDALADAAPPASVVESFALDNGLQVIVIPDHRAPVITHMLWYRVGSAEEPAGKSGIAHFLEHLMFKGTDKVPGNEFARIVARNGGQNNAFTSYDFTAYYQRIAREQLPRMMEMEADRMINLTLAPEDIPAERDVVLEERRSRIETRPISLLGEKMSAALYGEHPYGRPIIGWREEITVLDAEDALAFYRRFYAPDNAALVVAGDITARELRSLAETHYGGIAAGGHGQRPPRPPIPDVPQGECDTQQQADTDALSQGQKCPVRITHEDARVAQPLLQRLYLAQSFNSAGLEHATAIEMLAEILGSGTTSRLYRQLVVERKLAVTAGAWASTELLDRGNIGVYAVPAEGVSLATLDAAVAEVIDALVADGITEKEMERVRRSYLADLVYGWDDQYQQAHIHGLSWSAGIPPQDVQRWPQVVRGMKLQQVNESARLYLRADNAVIGRLQAPTPQ